TAQSMEYFLAHFEVDSIDKKDKYKHLYFINPEGALAYVLPLNELSKSDLDSEIEWLVNL
ncbi:MAG: hypothetical protein ISR69_09750, partial [Gammaproteobacteria bacterium]|nr:hypothetical protein [Gammaproteobacteria bacterium]